MEQMSGIAHIPSAPLSGQSTITGSGVSAVVDNLPNTDYRATFSCLPPIVRH